MILAIQRGPGLVQGMAGGRGLGAFTQYINGDLQTFGDNPCAPGLTFIGGHCFRAPGTQETPYGTVAIPLAGPAGNNAIAAGILGGGVTCKTERVDAGPYAYEQNVCRNPAGVIMASADLEAEAAYARRQLQTVGQPTPRPATGAAPANSNPIPNSVRAAEPNNPPAAMSTTRPTPVATSTYGTPVGAVASHNAGVKTPTAVTTATGWNLPALPDFPDVSQYFANPFAPNSGYGGAVTIAVGLGALFLLPALFKGGR